MDRKVLWRRGWPRLRFNLAADDGVAAVEFAIIGPVFVMILMALLQYGVLIYKAIDIRFQANQYARAVAAQAIALADVPANCARRFAELGYVCRGTEDATSYTISVQYDTTPISIRLFPLPQTLDYSAYQVKYAVQ